MRFKYGVMRRRRGHFDPLIPTSQRKFRTSAGECVGYCFSFRRITLENCPSGNDVRCLRFGDEMLPASGIPRRSMDCVSIFPFPSVLEFSSFPQPTGHDAPYGESAPLWAHAPRFLLDRIAPTRLAWVNAQASNPGTLPPLVDNDRREDEIKQVDFGLARNKLSFCRKCRLAVRVPNGFTKARGDDRPFCDRWPDSGRQARGGLLIPSARIEAIDHGCVRNHNRCSARPFRRVREPASPPETGRTLWQGEPRARSVPRHQTGSGR